MTKILFCEQYQSISVLKWDNLIKTVAKETHFNLSFLKKLLPKCTGENKQYLLARWPSWHWLTAKCQWVGQHVHSWAHSQSTHWEWTRPPVHGGTPQCAYNLPFLMLKWVFTFTCNSTRELHSSTELRKFFYQWIFVLLFVCVKKNWNRWVCMYYFYYY